MTDDKRTKAELIDELAMAQQRVAKLQAAEAERAEAEARLRQSEALLKRSQAIGHVGSWEFDLDTRQLTWSDEVYRIFGLEPGTFDATYETFLDLVHPDDRAGVDGAYFASLREGRDGYEIEHRLTRQDTGEVRVVRERCEHIKDASGRIVRSVGILQDITEQKRAEAALKDSEREKAVILDSVSELVSYQDVDLTVIWANRAAAESVGRSAEELVGRHCYEIWPGRDQPCVDCPVVKAMDTGMPHAADTATPDGRLWAIKGYPVRGENGENVGAVEITLEITEQVRAQRAIEARQRYLEAVLSAAPDAIVTLDSENRIVDWNAGAERLFGHQRSEVIGQSIDPLIAHGDVLTEATAFTRLVSGGETLLGTETVRYRKDGAPVDVIVAGAPIVVDGELIGVVAIYTDITERKRAEAERERLLAEIDEHSRRMEQILATVPEGVLLVDAAGRLLQSNPAARQDLGILVGDEKPTALTHIGDRPLPELLTSPPTFGLWHEIKAKGRTYEAIARPVENGAEPELWVMVINDVTREREIRTQLHQQERLAAVGQLAAGIAHDFNNIMATIVLYAQMASRAPELPDRERERMQVIHQQAWHATRLIGQILDFSRRSVLERRPVDLLPLVKEQVKLLERTLPEDVRIELIYGRDTYTLNADPTRMQQMLTNLAVNARDAMPDGGTLHITLERIRVNQGKPPLVPDLEPGEWIQLQVSDTGIGIAPEALPHIFEPFFTTKEPGRGSGLGLAQVHGIVGQHGGRIKVESQVGKGATFTIYLPTAPVTPPETPALPTVGLPQGHGQTILVVEDDAALREALVDSLNQLNYHVLSATNGREALAILDAGQHEIALVLSDLVMPEMGGQSLFRAVQARALGVPVVMLSGHPMQTELEGLRAEGLAGWMLKPPELEGLARLLARALRGDRP